MEPLDPVAELMRLADAYAHVTALEYEHASHRADLSAAITKSLADARRLALEEAEQLAKTHKGYPTDVSNAIRALIDGKAGG